MDGDFGCWQMVCFASLWNLEDAQAKQGALYRLESITTHPKRNVNITSWSELVDILKEAENVTGRRLFLGMPSFSMLSFRIGCWFSNKVSWLAKPARLAWSFTSTGWLDSPAIFFSWENSIWTCCNSKAIEFDSTPAGLCVVLLVLELQFFWVSKPLLLVASVYNWSYSNLEEVSLCYWRICPFGVASKMLHREWHNGTACLLNRTGVHMNCMPDSGSWNHFCTINELNVDVRWTRVHSKSSSVKVHVIALSCINRLFYRILKIWQMTDK